MANTLNPYYEGNSPSNMISDDRFMFHTLNNWDFGVDNTGNLMDWENSQAIIRKAKSLGKVGVGALLNLYYDFYLILQLVQTYLTECLMPFAQVLLVTADGSIDCLQRPDAQEEVTSPLHYCEIITALQALSPGTVTVLLFIAIY